MGGIQRVSEGSVGGSESYAVGELSARKELHFTGDTGGADADRRDGGGLHHPKTQQTEPVLICGAVCDSGG